MRPFDNSYNSFTVGQTIYHDQMKTITESDNNLFCLLTLNTHPLHINNEYASVTRFKRPVVVGTLVLSVVVGMTVPDLSWKALANLRYDSVVHLAPVFIGDTLRAESIIITKNKSSSNRFGSVKVATSGYNQTDELVLSFERTFLFEITDEVV